MSVYSEASPTDRRKIRREMIREAVKMLRGSYPVAGQRIATARALVDRALAKEMRDGDAEGSTAQQDTLQ